MSAERRTDELAAIIEQSDFAEESAELVIEAGWMHPDDVERLANIGMNNDSAVDWKDRAEAAEAKITRVEALAGELEAADNGSKAADYRLARFVVSEIRTALASAEVSPDA